jgi:DnaK suppressor protein
MKKLKTTKQAVLPQINGDRAIVPLTEQVAAPSSVTAHANGHSNGHSNGSGHTNERRQQFLLKQKSRLLELRDAIMDTVSSVSRETLREPGGDGASVFATHPADAGSDAYDRDFAVSILAQERNALYEIEEALKRIDDGTYGICEVSGKPISDVRLEAIPFARCTVECQGQIEKQNKSQHFRQPVVSIFGRSEEDGAEAEEEEDAPGSELGKD